MNKLSKLKKVYPISSFKINDSDLAKRLKTIDPSNVYDNEFLLNITDKLRKMLDVDYVISLAAAKDASHVLAILFDVKANGTRVQVFLDEYNSPYIIH